MTKAAVIALGAAILLIEVWVAWSYAIDGDQRRWPESAARCEVRDEAGSLVEGAPAEADARPYPGFDADLPALPESFGTDDDVEVQPVLKVLVTSAAGTPLEHLRLVLARGGDVLATGFTDQDGVARFNASDEPLDAWVDAVTMTVRETIAAGTESARIVLPEGATISGRVEIDGKEPDGDCSLHWVREREVTMEGAPREVRKAILEWEPSSRKVRVGPGGSFVDSCFSPGWAGRVTVASRDDFLIVGGEGLAAPVEAPAVSAPIAAPACRVVLRARRLPPRAPVERTEENWGLRPRGPFGGRSDRKVAASTGPYTLEVTVADEDGGLYERTPEYDSCGCGEPQPVRLVDADEGVYGYAPPDGLLSMGGGPQSALGPGRYRFSNLPDREVRIQVEVEGGQVFEASARTTQGTARVIVPAMGRAYATWDLSVEPGRRVMLRLEPIGGSGVQRLRSVGGWDLSRGVGFVPNLVPGRYAVTLERGRFGAEHRWEGEALTSPADLVICAHESSSVALIR